MEERERGKQRQCCQVALGWPKVWLMTVKEDQSEKDVFSSCVELPICKLNVNRESDLIRLRVCS